MSTHLLRSLVFVAVCCLLILTARAQTTQHPQDLPVETIKFKTDLVVVDALVTDKRTRELIRNLKLQDFELYEDGQRQELEYLSQDKLPLSLVLLLDVSPSVIPVMEEIRNGALQALQRLKPEDEVALMIFSGHTELIQDFTKDRQLILAKLGEALEKTGSGTRIHDAAGQAARQFKHATLKNSRRVVLVITDNQGSMSRKYDDVSEASVRDAVIESRATFCGVIARSMLNALNGIMMQHPAIQEVTKKTSINPYVTLTGGEMTAATKETVNTRLGEMIDRLRNCYSVGYSPKNQNFNGKFRRIQLALPPESQKRLGVETVINTRQGYYAVAKDDEDILAIAKPEVAVSTKEAAANKPTGETRKESIAATTSAESNAEPTAAEKEAARQRTIEAFRQIFRPANPYQHLMMLDVRALNKKTGVAVTNLSPDDFVLEDNGVKKQFEHFSYGETPLSIVLMIDSAGNTGYALSALRRTARAWLNKLQPEDEIALMAFAAKSALVQGFTKDRKIITDRLRDFTEDAAKLNLGYGQDRVNAVFQAAEQLDKSAHPLHRRVVIVVTDDTESYAKGAADIATQMLSSTGCTVYGFVANGSNPSKKNSVKRAVIESAIFSFGNPITFAVGLGTRLGTQAAMDALLKDRSFNQVVSRSGGVLSRADGEAASDEIGALLSHLHNRYLIGFSPAAYIGGQRYRDLRLRLSPLAQKRAKDVVLVTTKGYFALRAEDAQAKQ